MTPNLLDDVVTHLTSIKSLKQLFITTVLISNIMAIYDLVFNQGQGLNSLINAYLAVYPTSASQEFYLSDVDLEFIKKVLEPYPDATVSLLELTRRSGIQPVPRYDKARKIVVYTGGVPSVVIALDPNLPDHVTQTIYYHFKGYENLDSPLPVPTP